MMPSTRFAWTDPQPVARVLVIDDNEFVSETIVQALEDDGHLVFEASDGNQGLEVFLEARPSVVITDIFMPEKEGIDTILELRALQPGVKIIAISGGGKRGDITVLDDALKLGADFALKKPFTMCQLQRTVERCLGGTF